MLYWVNTRDHPHDLLVNIKFLFSTYNQSDCVYPFINQCIPRLRLHGSCYYIKQTDSMLPCVCLVTDHRGRQNVVRTLVTHLAAPRVPLFCSQYHILTSSVIYYWTDARQHGIYLLKGVLSWTRPTVRLWKFQQNLTRAVNSPVAFKSSFTSAVVRSFSVLTCSILVTLVCSLAFVNVWRKKKKWHFGCKVCIIDTHEMLENHGRKIDCWPSLNACAESYHPVRPMTSMDSCFVYF